MHTKIDCLFFVHVDGGGEEFDGIDTALIVRNMMSHDIPIVIEEMGDTGNFTLGEGPGHGNYSVSGVVQLTHEQMHFTNTSILAPTRYIVHVNGSYSFLDEVPEFKRPASASEMEQAAEKDLETQLDEERAEGEGMYVDEPDVAFPHGSSE